MEWMDEWMHVMIKRNFPLSYAKSFWSSLDFQTYNVWTKIGTFKKSQICHFWNTMNSTFTWTIPQKMESVVPPNITSWIVRRPLWGLPWTQIFWNFMLRGTIDSFFVTLSTWKQAWPLRNRKFKLIICIIISTSPLK